MFIIYIISFIFLVVPFIYLKFRLGLAQYIIVDKNCTTIEAIKESWKLTKGHTMQYFLLTLSFISWFILLIITIKITSLWLISYFTTTISYFYKDLKSIQS